MRIFLIGGTAFTGPPLIRELMERGHDVTFLHRGNTHDTRTKGAHEIIADRKESSRLIDAIASTSPDIVVDMIPFTEEDAKATLIACKNVVPRVVALSSIDVYLAYGRIWKTEPGPIQPTPLTETSALRETNQPEGPERDKIAVERAFMDDANVSATILRLPAIYGPRDKQRRFRCYLKRMDDKRKSILLSKTISTWKFSRGYVDNVAHAIALAIEDDRASGKVFNVAEPIAMTETEFVRAIGKAAGWHGEVTVLQDAQMPKHIAPSVNFEQDWNVDTQKIRAQLGYTEIVDAHDAIRRTVEWERANPPEVETIEYDYDQEDKAISDE